MAELTIEKLRSILHGQEGADVAALVDGVHPADLADLLERLDDDERIQVFRSLPPELASETLAELEGQGRGRLLEGADPDQVQAIFEELADDDAADILADLDRAEAEQILGDIDRKSVV